MAEQILEKIYTKCEREGGCLVWRGRSLSNSGYPVMTLKLPGELTSKTRTIHRIIYSLELKKDLNQPNFQISHLCHQKLCLDITHLNYEAAAVNMQRQNCRSNGVCLGHEEEPDCLVIDNIGYYYNYMVLICINVYKHNKSSLSAVRGPTVL